MDYCSSCRRHLNGALVCPGCGAYAPDIDPSAADGRTGPAAPPAWREGNVWDDRTVWDGARSGTRELPLAYTGPFGGRENPATDPAGGHEIPDTDPSGGHGSAGTAAADDYQVPQQGRAARRRQMARWKKNQRRAVVATAVALVGGGLTVAAMKGDSTPGVQAATAPEDTTMGGAGERPRRTPNRRRPSATPRVPRPRSPGPARPRTASSPGPPLPAPRRRTRGRTPPPRPASCR
ncbi:hypothetical protein SPURM210S_06669 [Streptomyces purpurascens]